VDEIRALRMQEATFADVVQPMMLKMIGMASGLLCLHLNGLIHGQLILENVKIDQTGVAKLADFSLQLVENVTSHRSYNACLSLAVALPATPFISKID
jgi:serine/threonine protein kinase